MAANNDSTTVSSDPFKISLLYGNGIQQNGRNLPANQSFLKPAFRYTSDLGFYGAVSALFFPSEKKRKLDNISLNLGYDYDITESFSAGVDYTYSYYYSTKQLAALSPHILMLDLSWYNSIVTPSVYCIFDMGKKGTDYTFNLDLTHVFIIHHIFAKKDRIIVPLSAGGYAGTSKLYKEYLLTLSKPTSTSLATINTINRGFQLTSLYLLSGLKYRIGCFSLGGTLYYDWQFDSSSRSFQNGNLITTINTAFYF